MQVTISVDDLTELQNKARPFAQWLLEYEDKTLVVETRSSGNGVDIEFRYANINELPILEGDARKIVIDQIQKLEEEDENEVQ